MIRNASFVDDRLITVSITSGDRNYWNEFRWGGYMIFWRLFFSILAGFTASLSLAKLVLYWKHQGFSITVPKLALGVTLAGSIFRCFLAALDPMYQGYHDSPARSSHMTNSIHFPVTVVTNLLIALYWKDSIDRSEVGNSGILRQMKIPFIAAASIVIVSEVVTSSLRAAEVSSAGVGVTFTGVIYILISLTTGIFFLVMGVKVIRRIQGSFEMTKGNSGVKATLKRVRTDGCLLFAQPQSDHLRSISWQTTFLVMSSSIFNVIFAAGLVQAVRDSWFFSITGWATSWTFIYFGIEGGSLIHAITVRAPTSPDSSRPRGSR